MAREIKIAMTSVWLIVSAISLLVLVAFYVVPDDALITLSAACQLPHHHHEPCPLCGMTRAFIAITHGDLDQATTCNRWSVALYGVMLANGLLTTIVLVSRIRTMLLLYSVTSFRN